MATATTAGTKNKWAIANTIVVLYALIPIIFFVLFFQRRIVAGLTSGAVKG